MFRKYLKMGMVMNLVLIIIQFLLSLCQTFIKRKKEKKLKKRQYKMFGFIKKCFFYWISIFINFNKREFVELFFNKQLRMQNKDTNC